jgi:outer membrane protein assembly factor BamA
MEMRLRLFLVAAICLSAVASGTAEQPSSRVRSVMVVGNESTPQTAILREVPLYPGAEFTDADLRRIEKNLARLSWLFDVDRPNRPKVWVSHPEEKGAFKDIVVEIKERPLTPYLWKAADLLCPDKPEVACDVLMALTAPRSPTPANPSAPEQTPGPRR